MAKIVFFLAYFVSLISANIRECPGDDCIPAQGAILVAQCGVGELTLDCTDENTCQDMDIYSGASSTTITCSDKDSCKNLAIFVNAPDFVPDEVDSDYRVVECSPGPVPVSVTLNCNSEVACKDANVTALGVTSVTIVAKDKDAFDEGIINCKGSTLCTLQCSREENACDEAICESPCSCSCDEVSLPARQTFNDGVCRCPGYTVNPTPAPQTPAPIPAPAPAPEPAPAPAPAPEYVRCTEADIDNKGVCTLSDLKGGDTVVVTVNDGVEKLVIKCSKPQQCKKTTDPLIVYSAANDTEITCDASQACMDALINVGNQIEPPEGFEENDFKNDGTGAFNSAALNCYNEQACKEANFTAIGVFADGVTVMAMGDQSYQDTKTECNKGCTVKCNEDNYQACGTPICDEPCSIIIAPMSGTSRQHVKKMSGVAAISGTQGGTVVLDANEQDCTIDCTGNAQCIKSDKVFEVFSGCNRTTIDCTGYDACKEGVFNLGDLSGSLLPTGRSEEDFSGYKESLVINCGENGCEKTVFNIVGNIGTIIVNAGSQDSLKDGELNCLANNCRINCGQKGSNFDSCKDLEVNCNSGCECHGGSCVDIKTSDNVKVYTPSPTSVTPSPTPEPTPAPTQGPTKAPTRSDSITHTPPNPGTPGSTDLQILVCKNHVGTCTIDCNNVKEQCDGRLRVVSGANRTIILCDAVDTCKMGKVFIGAAVTQTVLNDLGLNSLSPDKFVNEGAESVEVNCQAASGCKGLSLDVSQDLSKKVTVLVGSNSDALKDGVVTVNGGTKCEINCGDNNPAGTSCSGLTNNGCDCLGTNCPGATQHPSTPPTDSPTPPARLKGIANPNNNNINGGKHYPIFLPTAIIVCISFGLICLIAFFIYYKFFTNESTKGRLLSDEIINHNVYDTFDNNKNDIQALEMENYTKAI